MTRHQQQLWGLTLAVLAVVVGLIISRPMPTAQPPCAMAQK